MPDRSAVEHLPKEYKQSTLLLRGLALVLCLTGSLLPMLGPVSLVTVGTAGISLVLILDLLRTARVPVGLGFLALVFGALSLPWLWLEPAAVVTEYGAQKFSGLLTLTLLSAAGALTILSRRGLVAFAKMWILIAVGLALGALTGLTDSAGRAIGITEANPIWLARAIAAGAVFMAWFTLTRRIRLAPGLIVVLVLLAGIFATGSRGPMLGAIAGVVVILLAVGRLSGAIGLAALGVAGFIFTQTSAVFRDSRFGTSLESGARDINTQSRLDMWRDTVGIIADNPLGVGLGNWAENAPSAGFLFYPHNLFLEVFAESGWITGSVIVCALAFVVIRLARRAHRDSASALALAFLANETASVVVSGDVNARTWFFALVLGWVVSKWPAAGDPSVDDGLALRRDEVERDRESRRADHSG